MIEINEKITTKKNNLYLTRSLYLLKTNFPTSETCFYFLFFLKYLGVIANSRIIEMVTCKDSVSLNKYFKNLFLFGKDFSVMHKHYFSLSIAIAVIILIYLFFFGFVLLYMKYKYKNITSILEEKSYGTNEKLENIFFKIISYTTFIFIFFNQYFLEYIFFGIFGFIYNQLGITTKAGTHKNYANYLEPELVEYLDNTNHIPIFIINMIIALLLLTNLCNYLMFSSIRGLFLYKGILCGNLKFICLKLIMFSFQPFFALTQFYNDDTKITIGIIFNIIIIFLCLLTFWNCFYQFGYYPNNIANMCLFLEFFVFVSSIDELVVYYVGYKTSSIFFFVKILVEIINSFILTLLFLYLKDKRSMNNFAKNLFSKNSTDISKAGLYYYMRIFLNYQKNKSDNYVELFRIIMLHVKQCKKLDCPGHILIPKDYLQSLFIPFSFKDKGDYKNNIFANKESEKEIKEDLSESKNDNEQDIDIDDEKNNLKENVNINNYNDHSHVNIEKKKLTEKQFQIIFEQEIINKIEYLYKTKKIYDLEHFIFIHIQYLYKMKKNYALTLYYIGKYSKCGIKWNFITEYYFYEYKISIIHSYFNKLNINNADKTINKYRKDNLFMSEMINYFVLLALLKQLIITSCDKLKKLFNFRKSLHNPIMIKTYKHSNTNRFFKIGDELKYNIDKILHLTRLGLNQENKDNISAELIYIISNFLLITLNKIPDDLRKVINPNLDINSISKKLESGYKFFNLVHPLILTLTKNNTFNITYFSCVISNRLGFHQHELKDKDFHEKLFPGVKFIKQHELMMKQFLFFSYNTYAKANTFIKSKDGYLVGVSIVAKKFPTFYEDFFIIIGLDFNEKLFYSKINKSFNRYSFLLDENSEFIAETKNFAEDFEFNISMFKDIRTNFFEFFCVDKNIIFEKIKKKNKELFKHGVNNIYNLKKEEDAFTLFKNVSYEKAYELRDITKLETINKNFIIIYDKIEKDKIIRVIPEFSKLIEEYGLDFEWYQHLQNLSDRLSMKDIKTYIDDNIENSLNTLTIGQTISTFQGFKNIITPGNNSNNTSLNLKNKELKEIKEVKESNLIYSDSLGRPSYASISSASKKNFNNKMMRISFERNFDVIYNLKKMGTIYFYIVDLFERTIYTDDNASIVKSKRSFNNRMPLEKNSPKLMNSKNENNQYIKAKTIFNNKLNIKTSFDFPSSKADLKDENSMKNIKDIKVIEKTKTWKNEKNNNYIGENLNNEGEKKISGSHKLKIEEEKKPNLTNSKIKDGLNAPRKSKKDIETFKNGLSDKIDFYDNNSSSSYNYKSNRDDDDENISLISKDQIEELRKRDSYFNKIYIIILTNLFLFTIIIISVKLYYATTNFSYILNLTSSLIYLEEIKSDIFIGSVIVISQCLRYQQNDIPTGLNMIPLQLSIKGQDLMTHLNSFEKQLNIINDNTLLTNIRKLLYKNITIGNLNKDWSLKIEISCLINEINYFSFLLNTASQSSMVMNDTSCDFNENFFYLSVVNDPYEIYEMFHLETNFNQRFIYYVLDNIIYDIQPVIVDTTNEIVIALIKTLDTYLNKIIIIYICMLVLILGIEIIFLIKNNSDIYFIRQIFVFLYNYENNQLKKEFEINFLEKVAKEFNINNLTLLEKIKKDNSFFYSLINSNSGQLINDNSNNHDKSYNKINEKSLIGIDKNGKIKNKEKQEESLINDYQKIKNNMEQNSMNGSLLNNSINNNSSMLQLINKNNNKGILNDLKIETKSTNKIKRGKKMKSVKMNKANKMKFNEEQKIFKENEDVLELLKTNRRLVPLNTIISIYISIILGVLFMATLIISLFDLYTKRDTWEYAVNLSMNYLEKIPKIVEIGFTSYLTTILGRFKADYYPLEEYKSHQDLYLTYFTKRKGYDKSELISTSMNPSYFMNILYDNYRLKKNLEFCENDNFFSGHFKQIKSWIKKLDEKNNFCINAGLGGALFFNKGVNDVHSYFSFVEQMAVSCREEGEKLDESGLDLEMDFVLQELTYMYSDFEQQMKIDLTMARNMFFGSSNNLRILKDMNVPFSFASGTIYFAIDKDMNDLTNYISKFELVFVIITFIIDGLFLLYIFWIVTLNEKDKNTILYITKIIQIE